MAIAPGFFDRAGDPAPLTDFSRRIMKIVAAASDQQVMGDVGATLKYLEAQPYVDCHKLAITGFCWGGKVVWNACETFRTSRPASPGTAAWRRRRRAADPAHRGSGRSSMPPS